MIGKTFSLASTEAQRALRTTQYAVNVEAILLLAEMCKVIAGEAAVKFGKICAIR